jgi:hypothetical protein
MAVLFTRQDLDRVKATLDAVQTVGQAHAVVVATSGYLSGVAAAIYQSWFEDAWRTQARRDLFGYQQALEREVSALKGADPRMAVGATWKTLRPVVNTAWNYAMIVKQQFPPGETTDAQRAGDAMRRGADALLHGVAQAPRLVAAATEAVVKTAAKTAKVLTVAAADLAGSTAAAALGPLKWLLIGAGVLAVAGGLGYVALTRGR